MNKFGDKLFKKNPNYLKNMSLKPNTNYRCYISISSIDTLNTVVIKCIVEKPYFNFPRINMCIQIYYTRQSCVPAQCSIRWRTPKTRRHSRKCIHTQNRLSVYAFRIQHNTKRPTWMRHQPTWTTVWSRGRPSLLPQYRWARKFQHPPYDRSLSTKRFTKTIQYV